MIIQNKESDIVCVLVYVVVVTKVGFKMEIHASVDLTGEVWIREVKDLNCQQQRLKQRLHHHKKLIQQIMEVTEMIISSLSLSIFQVRCIDNSVSYNALQCLKG